MSATSGVKRVREEDVEPSSKKTMFCLTFGMVFYDMVPCISKIMPFSPFYPDQVAHVVAELNRFPIRESAQFCHIVELEEDQLYSLTGLLIMHNGYKYCMPVGSVELRHTHYACRREDNTIETVEYPPEIQWTEDRFNEAMNAANMLPIEGLK